MLVVVFDPKGVVLIARQFDNRTPTCGGTFTVEGAGTLANWLKEKSKDGMHPHVAMAACEHVHAAVLQVLLALKPVLDSTPPHPHLQHVLAAALPAHDSATA